MDGDGLGRGVDPAASLEIVERVYIRYTRRLLKDRGASEYFEDIPHAIWSILRFLGKHLSYDCIELGSHVFIADENRRDRCRKVFAQEFVGCVSGKGSAAGDQFIDHATHRVDIASRVQGLSSDLFWGHVRSSPFNFGFASKEFAESRFDFFGDRKVDHFDFPIPAQKKIIRLDIAVDISLGVQEVECLGGLFDDARQLVCDGFGTFSHGHFQVEFAEKFQNDERGFGIGSILDEFDDVLVAHRFCHSKLMLEERDFLLVSSLFGAEYF